jgi:hypothetical protein
MKCSLALLFLFALVSSCTDNNSGDSKTSDSASSKSTPDSPRNAAVLDEDTEESGESPSALGSRWKKLKLDTTKIRDLIAAPGFAKLRFIPVQARASGIIKLHTCALNAAGEPIAGKCAELKEGDHDNNPAYREIDLPGWSLKKADIEDFLKSHVLTKHLFLVPVTLNAKGEEKEGILTDTYRTYRVDIGTDQTKLYLNPSPPGLIR